MEVQADMFENKPGMLNADFKVQGAACLFLKKKKCYALKREWIRMHIK